MTQAEALFTSAARTAYPEVVSVEVVDDRRLHLTFADGARRVFDVSPFLPSADGQRGRAFANLIDPAYFRWVRVANGTIEWPQGQDFDPATLLECGEPVA